MLSSSGDTSAAVQRPRLFPPDFVAGTAEVTADVLAAVTAADDVLVVLVGICGGGTDGVVVTELIGLGIELETAADVVTAVVLLLT